jgi:hypothetical protein
VSECSFDEVPSISLIHLLAIALDGKEPNAHEYYEIRRAPDTELIGIKRKGNAFEECAQLEISEGLVLAGFPQGLSALWRLN